MPLQGLAGRSEARKHIGSFNSIDSSISRDELTGELGLRPQG